MEAPVIDSSDFTISLQIVCICCD